MKSAIYAIPIFVFFSVVVAERSAASEAIFSTWEFMDENVFELLKGGYVLVEYKQKEVGEIIIENCVIHRGAGIVRCENFTHSKTKSTNSVCQRLTVTHQKAP